MLMSCRMVYDIGPVIPENLVYPPGIAHGPDQYRQIQPRIIPFQFLLDLVGIVLIDIQDDQTLWIVPGHLPAQFTADGAAAAGDQHGFVLHIADDLIHIDLYGIPAQQILNLYLPQIGHVHISLDDLIHARQDLDPAAGLLTDLNQGP